METNVSQVIFSTKSILLSLLLIDHFRFMLVGEPYAGKTCILHSLAKTLNIIAEKDRKNFNEHGVVMSTMNPKAITLAQIYGAFDKTNQDVSSR